MGVRESLNKNAGVIMVVCTMLILAAIGSLMWSLKPAPLPANPKLAYYSSDDGKTFFPDDAKKIAPFDHGGSPAYRAYVYRCASGQTMVAYLERLSESGMAKLDAAASQPAGDADSEPAAIIGGNMEVKRPGESDWVPATDQKASEIVNVVCTDGSSPVAAIYPQEVPRQK